MLAPSLYSRQLDEFLDLHTGTGRPTVPAIYDAVRNLTYASDGNRTPETVLATGKGSCTGKHLLLRDLLRHVGEHADVEFIKGDFAASMPVVPSMSDELKQWVSSGGISDFHCYVVWQGGERELKLDATWPDTLAALGFSVNRHWDGKSDTRLAINSGTVSGRAEDVVERKKTLLETLTEKQIKDRLSFLKLLTEWMPQ
ncbi:MAG: hypothetical protein U1E67_13295 [Hyphomicrobiales bacterium]